MTVVTPLALGSAEAARLWLKQTGGDTEAAGRLVALAVGLLNRAIHAQRAASQDPFLHEVSSRAALAIRLGFGSGEKLADGRWQEATELSPPKEPRRSRDDALSPQRRVAAVLGGKEQIDACETLVLRARIDLDGGRPREAALQIRVGAESLLTELAGAVDVEQTEDLALLDGLRPEIGVAANTALNGELDAQALDTVRTATEVSERILRRRRLRAG